ncbi:MAG TPA: putative Ig domain-containing protein [Candidatus Eisenbacteria bacterium]|nr:putative Ig domain-containing protein [Candidatus Eisenbacteria bacterium]
MKSVARFLVVAAVCLAAFAAPASAQYMYLDSNGDGVNTAADLLNANGVPTTVDVWLRTNVNADGSPATCVTGDGDLTINSYVTNMQATGGTVTYSGFTNLQASMVTVTVPGTPLASDTEFSVGRGGSAILTPGDYKLFTMTITGVSGAPSVNIVALSALQQTDLTNFGAACSGNSFDNTMKLGDEWFDVAGLGAAPGGNLNPIITAPATATGSENSSISVTGSATDPDVQNVTLSQTNNAPFFTASSSAGPSLSPSITLTGTPNFDQAGGYTVNWSAADATTGTAAATTAVTINDVNRPPVITAPATASGTENSAVSVTASASDPDGNNLVLSQTNNAAFLAGPSSAGPALNPSITLSGTPSFTQSGSYTVNWTGNDLVGGTSTATTALTIANLNRNPVITAPATAGGVALSSVSVTGSASDPDAQNVTLSQTNDAPFFTASSSAGPSLNPSITLTGTPSAAGSFTVNWSANDGAGGTAAAATALTITAGNQAPVITAPATVSGTENSAVSITGSASDPDADQVTLSQTNDAAFLAGAASAGPALNPSITLTGTPSFTQSGSYTVNWSANDGAGGTAAATTALTIANLNRNPSITAPATVSGTENTAVSITGSASDPDAQNVTLSQTNNAAFLTGAASAGPALNPSITLTGTPSFSQSGGYTVNWSATDASAGTAAATTALTIANLNRNPVITAPATASGVTGVAVSVTGSASDPDAENVTLSQTNDAPFFTASSSAGPSLNPSITLTGTPSATGTFTVNWSATDASAGTASATTALTIGTGNQAPVITAPATVSGTENSAVSITASASDPEGQDVTLSQTNDAAFLTGPASAGPVANPSLTLTGTPDFTQAGSYTVNWSANDGAGGTAAATTALTIANLNRNPVITAPATVSGTENTAVSITGSATDPDAENVTLSQTNDAAFLTGAASNGPSLNPSITLTGTPSFSQSGSYTVNWSATDASAGTAAATTALTIENVNQNPIITAPASVNGMETVAVSITGSASDPDGDDVTLSQTNDAAFLTGSASAGPALNPSITLTGTPALGQAGSYTVNWSATDATTGTASATTALNIGPKVNQNPVITAPATVSGTEGTAVSITGSASDPDGDDVTLSQTNNAAFLSGSASAGPALNPSITLSGTPGASDAGSYTVNWSAADVTTGTAAATTALTIANQNQAPTLDQPADMTVNEGATDSQQLTASDPDSDPLTYSKVGTTPLFMSVSASGLVQLSPGFSDAGSYTGTARVSDGAASDTKSFAITVVNVNRCPTAAFVGAPYSGIVNLPVTFNGSASSDPDGDPLTYAWSFGDGSNSTGAIVTHAYAAGGVYTVGLTVDDGVCNNSASTTATISTEFPASVFTTGGNNTTSLNAGKPTTCVQIEPVNGSFAITDVNLASIKMISIGTGSVSEIFAGGSKTTVDGDKNHNGIDEIAACFSKDDLRLLFSNLPAGKNTVTVAVEGDLVTGGKFRGELVHVVKASGGALVAAVSPNPLNPETTLSFSMDTPGRVTVKVFDVNGRLVRSLLDDSRGAGYQDVRWNGADGNGVKVASGIYYFRLDTPNGRIVKAVTVLK